MTEARAGDGGANGELADGPLLVVRGGTVIDQTGERLADVLVAGDRVVEVGVLESVPRGARVLDATGCVVAPGLVDLHTHLRQPGREEAETVDSGARAASLGGFTAVVAMPNTEPTLDSAEAVRNVYELATKATAEVAVAGAITVGRQGHSAWRPWRRWPSWGCASSPTTVAACSPPGSCAGRSSTPPASG